MNSRQQAKNRINLRVEAIQYFPNHRCPVCGVQPTISRRGEMFVLFQDLFLSALYEWQGYFGYVYFNCECRHKELSTPGSRRVALLGDELIPVDFAGFSEAGEIGPDPDVLNAHRVAQAVNFLSCYVDPARIAGVEPIMKMILGVTSGAVGLDEVHRCINGWLTGGPLPVQVSPIQIQHA
jgi:hypothetical protein